MTSIKLARQLKLLDHSFIPGLTYEVASDNKIMIVTKSWRIVVETFPLLPPNLYFADGEDSFVQVCVEQYCPAHDIRSLIVHALIQNNLL